MSCEGFLRNNRGINDGGDLPPEFMRGLYKRIVSNEIKVRRVFVCVCVCVLGGGIVGRAARKASLCMTLAPGAAPNSGPAVVVVLPPLSACRRQPCIPLPRPSPPNPDEGRVSPGRQQGGCRGGCCTRQPAHECAVVHRGRGTRRRVGRCVCVRVLCGGGWVCGACGGW